MPPCDFFLTCFIQINTTPKKKIPQQLGSFDIDPGHWECFSFQAFKVGLGLLLIHSSPQIIKSAIFIEISLSDMGVHQGDQLRLVETETRDDGRYFLVLGLCLVVGQVIAEGTLAIDLHITALDVMEKDFGDFLVLLGERRKGSVQIGQGSFLGLFITALQDFEIFLKTRVHVVGVDLAGVNFGDVAIDLEWNALATTAATPTQFFVALEKRQILMVANGELDLRLGIFAELIHRFFPRKALDLRGLEDGAELVELLGKGRTCREVVRQLHKVRDARCVENGRYLGKARVHPLQIHR